MARATTRYIIILLLWATALGMAAGAQAQHTPAGSSSQAAVDTARQQQQSTLNTRDGGDLKRVYAALGYVSLRRTWADFNGMIFAPDKVIRDFQHRDSTQSVTVVNRAAFAIDMMLHPHRDWDPGDYDPRITIYFAVLLILMAACIAWRATRAVLGSDHERELLGYKAGIDAVFWVMALVVSPMVFGYYDQYNPVLQWARSANDPRSLVYGVLPVSQCALLLGALWLLRLAVLRKPASSATRSVLMAMGTYLALAMAATAALLLLNLTGIDLITSLAGWAVSWNVIATVGCLLVLYLCLHIVVA